MKTSARLLVFLLCCLSLTAIAQEKNPPPSRVQKTTQTPTTSTQTPNEQPPQERERTTRRTEEQPWQQPATQPTQRERAESPEAERGAAQEFHFDMADQPSVQTHHQIRVGGQLIRYTATVGRLPIKNLDGRTEAQMFYVAYTLDGADPTTRPVTFAFNGGPGSASIWLHMGALGPRKVVLQPEGWMPPAPYRLMDNPYTPLDKTDLILVDAIGTGFSRPADNRAAHKYWGLKGDIESFGEFIRMYITRNDRWSSPLYLLGESYGTTRSAGISGYLENKGISFNGIILLSEVLNFETLVFAHTNDVPYPLILPSYTMIAAYHHKLAPDLMQDLAKTRAEVEQWAANEYALALDKGDRLTPQERQSVIDHLSRYTGLSKQDVDEADLRIDVRYFTHRLLADQKLRVGRLDGRYKAPDPNGYLDTPFYDPTSSATQPPFFTTFNDYLRRELNYKTDVPYFTSARDGFGAAFRWDWTPEQQGMGGGFEMGYADTASALRQAIVKDPYLRVLVMEGYYDLATPYFAANYTMAHMDLPPDYLRNISFATYESGHMVYLNTPMLEKMKNDVVNFINQTTLKQQQ